MGAPIEHWFDSDTALLSSLEASVVELIAQAVASRDQAVVAVSGGSTPRPLFARLSGAPLPWEKVWLTLVDERWVAPDNPDSNEKMVRDVLLQGKAAAARFVPLHNASPDAVLGTPNVRAALAKLPRPFDLVMLGMGEDGHTASLFPHAAELAEGLTTGEACLAVTPPKAPHQRMSLSAARILDSRQIILHISGQAKLAAYQEARRDGPIEDHPIRFFLRQDQVPIHVYATR